MEKFNIGDIVARKSYDFDILFKITAINGNMVDLVGLNVRIIADAPEFDLKIMDKNQVERMVSNIEKSRRMRINRCYNNLTKKNSIKREQTMPFEVVNPYENSNMTRKPGTVLHIDGDAEYARKCKEIYTRMGITSFSYYIPEPEQYKQVYSLLQKLRPNILILTGHDAFMRKKNDIYNIDNYKNSRHYVQAVLEARRYEHSLDNLVIFAGACQSFYEAIIQAGANFASSPKRVLIDMMDPLVVSETIAYTSVDEFVPIVNIISNTREGIRGVGGVQTRGQLRYGMPIT